MSDLWTRPFHAIYCTGADDFDMRINEGAANNYTLHSWELYVPGQGVGIIAVFQQGTPVGKIIEQPNPEHKGVVGEIKQEVEQLIHGKKKGKTQP